jgi:hypothetical protein
VISNHTCEHVSRAKVRGVSRLALERLGNVSSEGLVIGKQISAHLIRREKAALVFTQRCVLEIFGQASGRIPPERSDALGNFIDAHSKNAVLFLEERTKLSKGRADHVPTATLELYNQNLFVGKDLSQDADGVAACAWSRFTMYCLHIANLLIRSTHDGNSGAITTPRSMAN